MYVCARTGVCIMESSSGPPASGGGGAIPSGASSDGIKMQIVERGDVVFEMPEWFKIDEDATEAVYRDDNHHHGVRLSVSESESDAAAWLSETYPNAELWTETLHGREVQFATKVGKKPRVTVSVIAVGGKVYGLACTNDDVKKPKPDVTCSTIVRSLRVRGAPKAAGSAIQAPKRRPRALRPRPVLRQSVTPRRRPFPASRRRSSRARSLRGRAPACRAATCRAPSTPC